MHGSNPSLRGAGEKVKISHEQLNEIIKCKEDIIYFAENYFKIVTLDEGEQLIKLHEYQKRMLKAFVGGDDIRKHVVVLSSRQIGKCLVYESKVRLRNKKTGIIEEIEIGKIYDMLVISDLT